MAALTSWSLCPDSYILSRPGPEHGPRASLGKALALQEWQVGSGEQQSNQLLPLSLYHGP